VGKWLWWASAGQNACKKNKQCSIDGKCKLIIEGGVSMAGGRTGLGPGPGSVNGVSFGICWVFGCCSILIFETTSIHPTNHLKFNFTTITFKSQNIIEQQNVSLVVNTHLIY
jgi:hypothetical protein